MDTLICGISAFRFHKIPPWLFAMLPDDIDLSTRAGRSSVGKLGSYLAYLPAPVDVLVGDGSCRHSSRGLRFHLWQGELPPRSSIEIGSYAHVTSPAMTLATMASQLSYFELTMAAYEMCGTFSSIRLMHEHVEAAREALPRLGAFGSWRPVLDRRGNITDLWTRPPLLDVDELVEFAHSIKGRRGSRRLIEAAESVLGVCASPLEVQAAMLLVGRRSRGGAGIGPVELNRRVRLTAPVRAIASSDHLVVDQYYEGDPPAVIELQGAVAHDDERSAMRDADRLLALSAMGFRCLPITYRQLADVERCDRLARHLAGLLGREYREKTDRQRASERELRRYVFSDWTALGM